MPARGGMGLLERFGDVTAALDGLRLPVFLIGRDEHVLWLNAEAKERVGDLTGRRFVEAVAPESRVVTREAFSAKVLGAAKATEYEAVLMRPDGGRVTVEINSVPFEDHGHVVGVFGIAVVEEGEDATPAPTPQPLTPRQSQVLGLLGRGASTTQMAEEMGVSRETVRNHVRELLRRLGVHSRLEAVIAARGRGLL